MKQQHTTFHHLSHHLWESPRGLCMFMAIPPYFPIISGPHRPRPHRGPTGPFPFRSGSAPPSAAAARRAARWAPGLGVSSAAQQGEIHHLTGRHRVTGARAWNCLFQVIFWVPKKNARLHKNVFTMCQRQELVISTIKLVTTHQKLIMDHSILGVYLCKIGVGVDQNLCLSQANAVMNIPYAPTCTNYFGVQTRVSWSLATSEKCWSDRCPWNARNQPNQSYKKKKSGLIPWFLFLKPPPKQKHKRIYGDLWQESMVLMVSHVANASHASSSSSSSSSKKHCFKK